MCAMMHCVIERKYLKDVRADAHNNNSISQPLKIRNPTHGWPEDFFVYITVEENASSRLTALKEQHH